MTRDLPSLPALRSFEAAARRLSFSEAANELAVTQSAISRQVRQLEEVLGAPLFHRLHRSVALTPQGEALQGNLTAAFELIEAGVRKCRATSRQDTQTVVLSCHGTLTMRWLIPRLNRAHKAAPGVELRLTAEYGAIDFRTAAFDMAVRVGPGPWPDDADAAPMFEEFVGPVCAPDLIAPLGSRLKLKGLLKLPALHSETRPRGWEEWLAVTAPGLAAPDGQWFEHFYYMLEAAVAGVGVAVAPRVLVADDLRANRLAAPLGFAPSGNAYTLLTPRARLTDSSISAIRDWLLAEAGDARSEAVGEDDPIDG